MDHLQQLTEYLFHLVEDPGDINEHLFTLCDYAKRSESACELGVRTGVSTAALALGLARGASHRARPPELLCVDIADCSQVKALELARACGVAARFLQASSTAIELPEVDLLFIDSWHCYGHLKRELSLHHRRVRKWIVLHDTAVYGQFGEPVRWQADLIKLASDSGYSIEELYKGLNFALQDFLAAEPTWGIEAVHEHNHGLTILQRRSRH